MGFPYESDERKEYARLVKELSYGGVKVTAGVYNNADVSDIIGELRSSNTPLRAVHLVCNLLRCHRKNLTASGVVSPDVEHDRRVQDTVRER